MKFGECFILDCVGCTKIADFIVYVKQLSILKLVFLRGTSAQKQRCAPTITGLDDIVKSFGETEGTDLFLAPRK